MIRTTSCAVVVTSQLSSMPEAICANKRSELHQEVTRCQKNARVVVSRRQADGSVGWSQTTVTPSAVTHWQSHAALSLTSMSFVQLLCVACVQAPREHGEECYISVQSRLGQQRGHLRDHATRECRGPSRVAAVSSVRSETSTKIACCLHVSCPLRAVLMPA